MHSLISYDLPISFASDRETLRSDSKSFLVPTSNTGIFPVVLSRRFNQSPMSSTERGEVISYTKTAPLARRQ